MECAAAFPKSFEQRQLLGERGGALRPSCTGNAIQPTPSRPRRSGRHWKRIAESSRKRSPGASPYSRKSDPLGRRRRDWCAAWLMRKERSVVSDKPPASGVLKKDRVEADHAVAVSESPFSWDYRNPRRSRWRYSALQRHGDVIAEWNSPRIRSALHISRGPPLTSESTP